MRSKKKATEDAEKNLSETVMEHDGEREGKWLKSVGGGRCLRDPQKRDPGSEQRDAIAFWPETSLQCPDEKCSAMVFGRRFGEEGKGKRTSQNIIRLRKRRRTARGGGEYLSFSEKGGSKTHKKGDQGTKTRGKHPPAHKVQKKSRWGGK